MEKPTKLSYRAEIDGLRAFAVVSVILYHAQMVFFGRDWFEGGYIGVDIFFVISGYLITRIILAELCQENSFSFSHFYERRARRILPMLFLVIFATIPFAWQRLLPSGFVEYAESVLSSLFFGSNFFFYFSTTEYGSDDALLKPFLHTWSLGVEEQFYLLFPFVAIFAFKRFRKHFFAVLVALSLLSLLFAQITEVRNSEWNFYSPISRFWEMGVGSILAYRELELKPKKISLSHFLPLIGLCLIAYSVLVFDEKTPHPSFHTTIPILGVALIIAFASTDELIGKLFGSKPFVWVGLISYSAYLWHFPIFAFSRLGGVLSGWEKIGLIALTLLLSLLSYRLIERPFRNAKKIPTAMFLECLAAALIAATLLLAILTHYKLEALERAASSYTLDNKYLIDQRPGNFGRGWDIYGGKDSRLKNLLVLGDSHAFDFFQILKASKYSKLYNVQMCDFRFVYFEADRSSADYNSEMARGGIRRTQKCFDGGRFSNAQIVVISDSFSRAELKYVDALVKFLLAKDKAVVLLGRSLRWEKKPQLRTFLDEIYVENGNSFDGVDFSRETKNFYRARSSGEEADIDVLRSVAEKNEILFLDKRDYQCDIQMGRCDLVTTQLKKIYSDHQHVTLEGAQYFGLKISEMEWFNIE